MSLQRAAAFAASLLLVLTACGESGNGGNSAEDPAAPQAAAPEEIAVTVTDKAFEIPEILEAEPVNLTVTNDGEKPHNTFFARLNDGVTPDKVLKTFQKNPDAAFALITVAGSLPMTEPGGTNDVTILFPEGNYLIIDPEAKPPPPLAFFEVTAASGDEVAAPEADWSIEAGDFYFKVDGAASGESLVEISNVGEQSHEIILSKAPGKSRKDEVAFFLAPAPGGKMWTTLDLEPDEYKLICFFPDSESHKPHFKLGMEHTFTVE